MSVNHTYYQKYQWGILGLGDGNYYRIDKQQVVLYSTGSYIQYPVITIMENNMKKYIYIHIYILVCITESLCYTAEIKQHCKSNSMKLKAYYQCLSFLPCRFQIILENLQHFHWYCWHWRPYLLTSYLLTFNN